jgi:CheY-like chemotaxis protein
MPLRAYLQALRRIQAKMLACVPQSHSQLRSPLAPPLGTGVSLRAQATRARQLVLFLASGIILLARIECSASSPALRRVTLRCWSCIILACTAERAAMGQVSIVDDDQELRELLREILKEEGYRVIEAADGGTALDLLHLNPERLVVLLDYLMPKGDGKRVVQVVSRDAALSTRQVSILLTACMRLSLPVLELANALSLPMVRKPFESEVLLATVA